jgi:hypothetical protein
LTLFQETKTEQRRLKLYVFGESGTGKTVTGLHFPGLAVVDMDGGTDWYTDKFKMHRLKTMDIDQVFQAVDDLIKDPTGYKTLLIDSMTKFWELLQEKHLKRLRVKKGSPSYVLQPSDYRVIKSDLKSFINKLLALDLNIVATAQSKKIYANDTTEFMKVVGTEPDSSKDAPYLFDVVLELSFGPNDTRMAKVLKDRTNTLPKEFEYTYQELVKYFGIKDLEREPVQLRAEQVLNQMAGRKNKVKIGNKEILTAGVTAETLRALIEVTKGTNETALRDKLNDEYSVQSLLDLREDEAKMLLTDLQPKEQK